MSILVLLDISACLEDRTFLDSPDWQRSVPTDRHGAPPEARRPKAQPAQEPQRALRSVPVGERTYLAATLASPGPVNFGDFFIGILQKLT